MGAGGGVTLTRIQTCQSKQKRQQGVGKKGEERRARFIAGGTGRKDVTVGKGEQRSGGANNAENPSETT